jgi:hypothetical protein
MPAPMPRPTACRFAGLELAVDAALTERPPDRWIDQYGSAGRHPL